MSVTYTAPADLHERLLKLQRDKSETLSDLVEISAVLPHGELYRLHAWLRQQLTSSPAPSLDGVHTIIHEGIRYRTVRGAVARVEVTDERGRVLEEVALEWFAGGGR